MLIGARAARSAPDRRYFGAWKELTTRHHLHTIVKKRLKFTSTLLRAEGRAELAAELEAASPH